MQNELPPNRPWVNPSAEQEREWKERRLAALASTRKTVDVVVSLPTKAARRAFLADYREQWGNVCAGALEALVKTAWDHRRD